MSDFLSMTYKVGCEADCRCTDSATETARIPGRFGINYYRVCRHHWNELARAGKLVNPWGEPIIWRRKLTGRRPSVLAVAAVPPDASVTDKVLAAVAQCPGISSAELRKSLQGCSGISSVLLRLTRSGRLRRNRAGGVWTYRLGLGAAEGVGHAA